MVPALVSLAVALAGCVPRPPEAPQPPPAGAPAPGVPSLPPGARLYDVDPTRTRVTVLVYRAGPLSRLGHNHAITADREQGYVWLGKTPETSGFEVRVPVAAFVVDDPAARASAGPEFPGAVPDEARAGTTQNMLRPEVLDAGHYPEVIVRCDRATGTWQQLLAHVSIQLKDARREYDVPVVLAIDGNRLTATGNLSLRQTDFGIAPFSVAGGAIQVANQVDVRFEVAAVTHAAH